MRSKPLAILSEWKGQKIEVWVEVSERKMNWVQTVKAGNEDDGFAETLRGLGKKDGSCFGVERVI